MAKRLKMPPNTQIHHESVMWNLLATNSQCVPPIGDGIQYVLCQPGIHHSNQKVMFLSLFLDVFSHQETHKL